MLRHSAECKQPKLGGDDWSGKRDRKNEYSKDYVQQINTKTRKLRDRLSEKIKMAAIAAILDFWSI